MKFTKIMILYMFIIINLAACGGGSGTVTPSIQGKGAPERLE